MFHKQYTQKRFHPQGQNAPNIIFPDEDSRKCAGVASVEKKAPVKRFHVVQFVQSRYIQFTLGDRAHLLGICSVCQCFGKREPTNESGIQTWTGNENGGDCSGGVPGCADVQPRRSHAPVLQHQLEGDGREDARTGGSGLLLDLDSAADQGQRGLVGGLRPVRSLRSGRPQPAGFRRHPLRHGSRTAQHDRDRAPLRHPGLRGQHHEPPGLRHPGLQRRHPGGCLSGHGPRGFPPAPHGRRLLPQVGQLPRLDRCLAGHASGAFGPDRYCP